MCAHGVYDCIQTVSTSDEHEWARPDGTVAWGHGIQRTARHGDQKRVTCTASHQNLVTYVELK